MKKYSYEVFVQSDLPGVDDGMRVISSSHEDYGQGDYRIKAVNIKEARSIATKMLHRHNLEKFIDNNTEREPA